jgi:electron transfer flavoprotein beta subunit
VLIGACLKWVDLRPEVDPLTGEPAAPTRSSGASAADLAALEIALRLAEIWGAEVLALTAGPPPADAILRDALAAGAHRARRVDVSADLPSPAVAEALAGALDGATLVCCGDWSLDRGSGSVPAFLAAETGAAQALGLLAVSPAASSPGAPGPSAGSAAGGAPPALAAERRLDRGRREQLAVPLPAVISLEGGAARLRRATLAAVLAAGVAEIEVVAGPSLPAERRVRVERVGPYRPRARQRSAPASDLPARERILALTGALGASEPPRTVTATPDEAAEVILGQLRTWGYLEA